MKNPIKSKVASITKSSLFWSLLMFAGIIVTVLILLNSLTGTISDEQLNLLENSVRRSAIQCYVIEGAYPPDLQYLERNYGLYFDDDYVVHYQNQGGNILPEIDVFYIPSN